MNDPSRSRGTAGSTSPTLVATVVAAVPLRKFLRRGLGCTLLVAQVLTQFGLQPTLQASFDQLLNQPMIAIRTNLASIDHRVRLIKCTRGIQRPRTLTLRSSRAWILTSQRPLGCRGTHGGPVRTTAPVQTTPSPFPREQGTSPATSSPTVKPGEENEPRMRPCSALLALGWISDVAFGRTPTRHFVEIVRTSH